MEKAKKAKGRRQTSGNVGKGSEFGGKSRFGSPDHLMGDLRSIPLFPARYKCMLRYQEQVSVTSTTGAVGSYVFSANGLYDPNISSTGHQPAGFDQMMVSYEHYCVTRSRIMVTFSNGTAAVMPQVALSHRAASSALTVWGQVYEDGLVKTSQLTPVNVNGCITVMNMSADIAKFGGVDDLLDNPYYRGDIAANPTEQSYFHIQACDNITGTTCVVYLNVVIEYEAVFKEPRTLSQSMRNELHQRLRFESKESRK
jgi:hypothetical protein